MNTIHIYELDRAAKTFAHSADELKVAREQAVELLRCAADAPYSEFGRSIEEVALELDCSLFVTLLARMWAQNIMLLYGEAFENTNIVLLEAALQLEDEIKKDYCTECEHPQSEHGVDDQGFLYCGFTYFNEKGITCGCDCGFNWGR